jgi:hypothetical protein
MAYIGDVAFTAWTHLSLESLVVTPARTRMGRTSWWQFSRAMCSTASTSPRESLTAASGAIRHPSQQWGGHPGIRDHHGVKWVRRFNARSRCS